MYEKSGVRWGNYADSNRLTFSVVRYGDYLYDAFSRGVKNSVGAMAIVTGGLFVAGLVSIPPSMGILSQLWSYLPINILKIDEGFADLRLVRFFGTKLTTWQFAPILYLILIGVMVWGGSKVYKNYQVSGR